MLNWASFSINKAPKSIHTKQVVLCHDPKTDMIELVYSNQYMSASTQQHEKKFRNINKEQDKSGKHILSIIK